MNVGELASSELRDRLRRGRLYLRTGPFVYRITTELPKVAAGFAHLYEDFPLEANESFADFHVRLSRCRGPRRWFAPLAQFKVGGGGTFEPFPLYSVYAYFEWGLNWCVYNLAHQYLVLHAATLERNGRAVMLVGASGSGKSTLCAALAMSGWRLLSDEFALISPQRLDLTALPRPISLKNDSVEIIRNRFPDATVGEPSGTERKGVIAHVKPARESVERAAESAEPACFIFLKYERDAGADLTLSRKGMATMRIAHQAFNYGILGATGFRTLTQVIDRCDCFHLRYGQLDAALELLGELPAFAEREKTLA